MIKYRITGSLPAPWEDFLCVGKTHPNVTVLGCNEDIGGEEETEKWYLIQVDEEEVTDAIARRAIASCLECFPEEIEIIEEGFIQAS